MKVGITSDCSSGLEYCNYDHKIKITRTTIHFGEEELVDGVDITADGFYNRLSNTDLVPSTSAPTPEELITKAESYINEGCTDVIHFPISFKLSAYGENLLKLKDEYVEGANYHVFNSHQACFAQGLTARYAEVLANNGYSVEEIFDLCQKFCDNIYTYFVVDDLKYLVKNGRLNVASGFIGSLIRIKPILELGLNGTIDVYEKVRTHNKAIDRLVEIVKEKTKDMHNVVYFVQHTNRLDEANSLCERIKGEYQNGTKFFVATVPPTVGCHIGCGVLSIGFACLDDLKEQLF